jgi:hypothetical protein
LRDEVAQIDVSHEWADRKSLTADLRTCLTLTLCRPLLYWPQAVRRSQRGSPHRAKAPMALKTPGLKTLQLNFSV